MHDLDIKQWNRVKTLFETHRLYKSIISPCAQSEIGTLSVDNINTPSVVKYSIPMMIFLAGDCDTHDALALVRSLPPMTVFVVPDNEWKSLLIKEWGRRLVTNQRTHMGHKNLDIEHLRKLKRELPVDFNLKKLDTSAIYQINDEYKKQIEMLFGKPENLIAKGIGFCILDGEKLVSVAYTPFPFIDEFEVQVYTENNPEYRRKGFATVVSAALIEYGLDNNLVPHWDAANQSSVKLAIKLGYNNPQPWEAFYYQSKSQNSF
ncbi:MAG: GNAT family N-acetyltransferase [Candidatus Thorarchaeota archaeon]|nr:GNAT family N-acetyltransferase [Candidatus Thorarchaeota archaeon]